MKKSPPSALYMLIDVYGCVIRTGSTKGVYLSEGTAKARIKDLLPYYRKIRILRVPTEHAEEIYEGVYIPAKR